MGATAVAKKKGGKLSQDKFEVRAEPEWLARLDAVAARMGQTRSAYVRFVLSQAMDRDERQVPPEKRET